MLDQFTINHIKAAFELSEEGQISPQARAKIAYCRRLIALAEENALMTHANAYAHAAGSSKQITSPAEAKRYLDKIAAECDRYGTN